MTEIAIRFKQAPYAAFQDTPVDTLRPNWLVLRIAPDEGISLQFEVKRRGPVVDLAAVKMDFRYDDWFPKEPNVGYETLIYDVMIGDPTLFMRADMVEAGLAHRAAGARRLGGEEGRFSRLRLPAATARRRPTNCWRATESGPGGRCIRLGAESHDGAARHPTVCSPTWTARWSPRTRC